jgi:pseudaminic acid cytidylyltransferase
MNICVIPARGGSKRIPMKNIREFSGKPIIAWSIETALKSKLFDKIIVSTDNEEIASVAKKYGAEVPFIRPKELADDFCGTNAVVKQTLQWFIKNDINIDNVCCIYATAPFIISKYLKEGYDKLIQSDKAFSFSVTSFPFPIQRALRINNQACLEAIWPENISTRSQDLDEAYHDAGQFYWGKAEAFLNDEVLYSNKSIPVILPRYLVQDIDTFEDWKRAEIMFNSLIEMGEL